jgi:hypothetical protein
MFNIIKKIKTHKNLNNLYNKIIIFKKYLIIILYNIYNI